jgi:hypothetical protein
MVGSAKDSAIALVPCANPINVWRAHACGSFWVEAMLARAANIMLANACAESSMLASSLLLASVGGAISVVGVEAGFSGGTVVGVLKKESIDAWRSLICLVGRLEPGSSIDVDVDDDNNDDGGRTGNDDAVGNDIAFLLRRLNLVVSLVGVLCFMRLSCFGGSSLSSAFRFSDGVEQRIVGAGGGRGFGLTAAGLGNTVVDGRCSVVPPISLGGLINDPRVRCRLTRRVREDISQAVRPEDHVPRHRTSTLHLRLAAGCSTDPIPWDRVLGWSQ